MLVMNADLVLSHHPAGGVILKTEKV